uniref:Nitric oxide associated 1 n=1 Tax=Eptatretus burgeri TaxID=7764 RepID=A0A8C4Q3I1_EPTBU
MLIRTLSPFCALRQSLCSKRTAVLSPSYFCHSVSSGTSGSSPGWRALSEGRPWEGAAGSASKGKSFTLELEEGSEEKFVFPTQVKNEAKDMAAHVARITDEYLKLNEKVNKTKVRQPYVTKTEFLHKMMDLRLRLVEPLLKSEAEGESVTRSNERLEREGSRLRQERKRETVALGIPNPQEPPSSTPCSGCGAFLQCFDPFKSGYLASSKFMALKVQGRLDGSICRRCNLLIHHKIALDAKISPEEFQKIMKQVRSKPALVLCMLDLFDLANTFVPDLLNMIGHNKTFFILGNKIDLIPADSKNYLKRIKDELLSMTSKVGINPSNNVKGVFLISAKTGYGIEDFISKLQSAWKHKGDVYLIGTTNVGKSTLFNTLLESDYCKSKAPDIIQRATTSTWPGTTLNLLKFPIINPLPYRVFQRLRRLRQEHENGVDNLDPNEKQRLRRMMSEGYLVGRIGRTFLSPRQRMKRKGVITWNMNKSAMTMDDINEEGHEEQNNVCKEEESDKDSWMNTLENAPEKFTHNELKDAHWLYDTPGIVKPDCVLNLLTEEEVQLVLPTRAIIPRTFILSPGSTLFLAGLGRIDYLEVLVQIRYFMAIWGLLAIHFHLTLTC